MAAQGCTDEQRHIRSRPVLRAAGSKERLAAEWTLAEFGQRTGYDPAHVSRIETGKRPATEVFARSCEQAFPDRAGWFTEFYEESRTWIAAPPLETHQWPMALAIPSVTFGRQVRRARHAAGWTLAEFGQHIGYDPGQISRIENGKRPPSELFAEMCDQAFPERDGWFTEFYAESRTWIATPPWFRSWVEHEQRAETLRIWQLGVFSGLLQTENYAHTILSVDPGVTEDQVNARLAARLSRQAILTRDGPPTVWFLVDEAALRRCTGSPQVMATQLAHLTGIARLPKVTIQVVPNIAHAGLLGGFAVAPRAAYVETAVAG
jgi:transcriptional regulator with XRE-family HTH domain